METLALIGLISAGLYALLALRYPLSPGLTLPRAGWADLVDASWASVAYHIAIYGGLTLLYTLALHLLLQSSKSGLARRVIVVVGWLVCSGILLTVVPSGESHDVFDYAFRGQMMVELGANPLTDVPDQYRRAPYYRYVAWRSHVDTYGPVWEMTNAGTAALLRGDIASNRTVEDALSRLPGVAGILPHPDRLHYGVSPAGYRADRMLCVAHRRDGPAEPPTPGCDCVGGLAVEPTTAHFDCRRRA